MKKKILISVYDMEIGGIERSLINMLEKFDYNKFTVDLFIFSHTGEFLSLIPKRVNVLPQVKMCTAFRKPMLQCIKEGNFIIPSIRMASKLMAFFKARKRKLEEGPGYIQMQLTSKYASGFLPEQDENYDLAISYAWPHDYIADKVSAKKKIAWIHTDYGKLEIDNELDFQMWNKFRYIASISEECTKAFIKKYPGLKDKVFLLENITSAEFIKKMAGERNEEENGEEIKNCFEIVSVGRLSYVKGFDMAVEALFELHAKGMTRIKWYVVGYGGYEQELKKLIKSKKLEDSFILLGKRSNPYPFMRKADLYVQPSRYEGKAVTVVEAQILAKPVLVTNYPTAASQVKDGWDGMICDLSVEGLVAGIEKLYSSEDLRKELADNCYRSSYKNDDELQKLYQLV